MKLRRLTPKRARQTLSVPRHRQLVTKTLFDIYKQACRFIPEEELRPYFYND